MPANRNRSIPPADVLLAEQARSQGWRALRQTIFKETGRAVSKSTIYGWGLSQPIPPYVRPIVERYVLDLGLKPSRPVRMDDLELLREFAQIVLKLPGLKEMLLGPLGQTLGPEDREVIESTVNRTSEGTI